MTDTTSTRQPVREPVEQTHPSTVIAVAALVVALGALAVSVVAISLAV